MKHGDFDRLKLINALIGTKSNDRDKILLLLADVISLIEPKTQDEIDFKYAARNYYKKQTYKP